MHTELAAPINHITELERRAWIRFGSGLEVTCCATTARREIGWTARLKNISRGGVGLVLRHRFRRGTQLLVEIRDRTGTARVLAARVVHSHAIMEDVEPGWFTGCSFETELGDDEFHDLT